MLYLSKLSIDSSSKLSKQRFKCGGAKVQVTGHRSGHRLQATGHRSGYRSGYKPQVTGHSLHATGHRSGYRPQVTGHRSGHKSHTKKNNKTLDKTVLD